MPSPQSPSELLLTRFLKFNSFRCIRAWVEQQEERSDGQTELIPLMEGRLFEHFVSILRKGVSWRSYSNVFSVFYRRSPHLDDDEKRIWPGKLSGLFLQYYLFRVRDLYKRKAEYIVSLKTTREAVSAVTKKEVDEAPADSTKEDASER